jgi:hypothetical protein
MKHLAQDEREAIKITAWLAVGVFAALILAWTLALTVPL